MIVTRNDEIARNTAALRNHGRYDSPVQHSDAADFWFEHAEMSVNCRLSETLFCTHSSAAGLCRVARHHPLAGQRIRRGTHFGAAFLQSHPR